MIFYVFLFRKRFTEKILSLRSQRNVNRWQNKKQKGMIQEIREKIFKFKIGQSIQIDNMNFKIKKMSIHLDRDESTYSVSIWGDEPNATTISKHRIVRLDNFLWFPRQIYVFTEQNHRIYTFCTDDELIAFIELQKTKKDKVVGISVEMDTMLNSYIGYHFD
jgi:hypothetical protein